MARKKSEGVGIPSDGAGMNKKYTPDIAPPSKAKGGTEPAVVNPEKKAKGRDLEADRKLLATAIKRFKRCIDAESDNRQKAKEDLKFKAGDQWPHDISQQRANEKRPCLTINTIPTLTHQVTNDLRQNRPAIVVSPYGSGADKEGAKAYAGMIRAIERDCSADIAYDTAITSAVDIGFGYWRINTKYENEKSFNQVLTVERIRNPFRVNLDPMRQEPDGCDAQFGFISDLIPRDQYDEEYPGASPCGWTEKGIGDELAQWVQKDFVRVAEYFSVEHTMERLVQLSSGAISFWDDLDDAIKSQVEAGKLEILNERQVERQKVMWRKITAYDVLSERKWHGRWIPIVEVLGEEIDIDGKVIRSGMIRNVKDSARMKNYWATAKTEMVALAPKSPWVIAEGQIEGYEEKWKQAHIKSFTYLEYKPVSLEGQQVPPPQRQPMVGIPEGIVQAEQSSQQDMMATTGVRFDATGQDMLYDESGRALKEIRRNMDIGSFHFMDNACRSLRHTGRILIDLIPIIYDVKRVVTIIREDDTEDQITLNPEAGTPFQHTPQAKDKAARLVFDPTIGQYGVTVTTGPSYATKRIEAVEQLMQFARALPEKGSLIAHLIAKYSDWPGADEAYKILLKALPPQLIAPDLRDLPPQLSTFVQSMMKQIQQLSMERIQMLKDLTDQRGDRAIRQNKIDRDFEAKMLKIFADAKSKLIEIGSQDVREAVAITDQTRPETPAGVTGGGVASGQPQFPSNPAALPVSPVSQPTM